MLKYYKYFGNMSQRQINMNMHTFRFHTISKSQNPYHLNTEDLK